LYNVTHDNHQPVPLLLKTFVLSIKGIMEKPNHRKIKKLKPKWEKRAKKLLEKMDKKKKAAK
jgi:hypothetical protein